MAKFSSSTTAPSAPAAPSSTPTNAPSSLSLGQIAQDVRAKNGVLTMQLGEVRAALGFGRMGVHVKAQILSALNKEGLKVIPAQLPDRQTEMVRIYDPTSDLGRFLEAATTINPSTDIYLHEFAPNKKSSRAIAS